MTNLSIPSLALLICLPLQHAFIPISSSRQRKITPFLSASSRYNNEKNLSSSIRSEILEKLFSSSSRPSPLIPLTLGGTFQYNNTNFIAISPTSIQSTKTSTSDAVLLPMPTSALPLLQSAYRNERISKSRMLLLNSLLINVDDGLFDGIPWHIWSLDNVNVTDAAGNPIDQKYHFGKRNAYNRFLGKDWKGNSFSIGNLAQRLLYSVEQEPKEVLDENSLYTLTQRMLEIELKEKKSDLAQVEYDLALKLAEEQQEDVPTLHKMIQDYKTSIEDLERTLSSTSRPKNVLKEIVEMNNKNPAPYRGAYGYAPYIDSKEDYSSDDARYTSPFDLMNEILREQCNADVIGCVLENTCIIDDNTIMLGGAVVLQRRALTEVVTIDGEEVNVPLKNKDGSVPTGDVYVVECKGYEAVGMAMACGVKVLMDKELWERQCLLVEQSKEDGDADSIPLVTLSQTTDQVVGVVTSIQESELEQQQKTMFIPKTTSSLFSSSPASSSSTYNNNDPVIQSLEEYDALSTPQKAKILLSLNSFKGKLPRPRTLRTSGSKVLDELLIPLVDESIRRQYNIRDAEERGDTETANALRQTKSNRQKALEEAERARGNNEDVAKFYEEEAEFLKGLRADVTQDEGSYSRFLDKDDWYERERMKTVKRIKKSSFGTLLDGIE